MNDLKVPQRTAEILVALVVALGLAELTYIVHELGNTQSHSVVSVDWTQDPIAVFPDFAQVPDIDVKKQQFFDYIESYVVAENTRLLTMRKRLEIYSDVANSEGDLSPLERSWVMGLVEKYELYTESENEFDTLQAIIRELLLRVDAIPVSLALAQAATESAWGTSRFTLEGNNVFGQWCYEAGCGMVPERRVRGAVHEVQRFDSVASSVAAYFRNINTHHLYQEFRELRASMRKQEKGLNSLQLVHALDRYSERGDHYIDQLQTIIQQNKLQLRDRS